MQPEQILSSDLLDILFADRNKTYGAYSLRREYNLRLKKSLLITGAIVTLALTAFYSPRNSFAENVRPGTDVIIDPLSVDPGTPEPPLPPPPPPPPPGPKVATVKSFVPVIVIDEKADSPTPTVDELDKSLIGPLTMDGIDAPDIIAPPVDGGGKGITAIPRPCGDDNRRFIPIEAESEYPGGMAAWRRFLIKTLNYPGNAQEHGIEGRVMVKFVVDKDGAVSNIQAVSGPDDLRAEAIRVIGKSGKWTPALQNGNHVKSYKFQEIVFQLQNE